MSCVTSHPIHQYLSYQRLSDSYKTFILNVSTTYEAHTYQSAVQFDHWKEAMQNELDALESNKT